MEKIKRDITICLLISMFIAIAAPVIIALMVSKAQVIDELSIKAQITIALSALILAGIFGFITVVKKIQ
ncbi:MAG: hypothetical protein KatS3mg031_2964 [Chitinophagales bacterium]|nr:MAG: hypothetical protein KatS3mg031_2964 [Chitinophagales bacterium]